MRGCSGKNESMYFLHDKIIIIELLKINLFTKKI